MGCCFFCFVTRGTWSSAGNDKKRATNAGVRFLARKDKVWPKIFDKLCQFSCWNQRAVVCETSCRLQNWAKLRIINNFFPLLFLDFVNIQIWEDEEFGKETWVFTFLTLKRDLSLTQPNYSVNEIHSVSHIFVIFITVSVNRRRPGKQDWKSFAVWTDSLSKSEDRKCSLWLFSVSAFKCRRVLCVHPRPPTNTTSQPSHLNSLWQRCVWLVRRHIQEGAFLSNIPGRVKRGEGAGAASTDSPRCVLLWELVL